MRDKEIRVLCYGDSNTWGYVSNTSHHRHLKTERWTGILASLLGGGYTIIEEGLNSRTLISNDERPGKEGKNGSEYLIPCLDTHDPVDIVVLMLGTNELKTIFDKTPEDIGELIEANFIKVILNRKSQFMNTTPKLILVCPSLINEKTEYCQNKYEGATLKSRQLNEIYKSLAEKHNSLFIDNYDLETGPDGVHLNKESHKRLAYKLYDKIKSL